MHQLIGVDHKNVFFLSTARSGSKWLSEIFKNSTHCLLRMNILNQDYLRIESDKLTFYFRFLEENPKYVKNKFQEALEEYECEPNKDFAEVNVYLASFINELN